MDDTVTRRAVSPPPACPRCSTPCAHRPCRSGRRARPFHTTRWAHQALSLLDHARRARLRQQRVHGPVELFDGPICAMALPTWDSSPVMDLLLTYPPRAGPFLGVADARYGRRGPSAAGSLHAPDPRRDRGRGRRRKSAPGGSRELEILCSRWRVHSPTPPTRASDARGRHGADDVGGLVEPARARTTVTRPRPTRIGPRRSSTAA